MPTRYSDTPWNSRKACYSGWAIMAACLLSGCSIPPPTVTVNSTPPPVDSQFVVPQERPKPNQTSVAHQYLEQTKVRLGQTPKDPEFNGYRSLASIKMQKDGLLQLHARFKKKGEAAFVSELAPWEQLKASPLSEEMPKVKLAIRKPSLSAPLEATESGPIEVPQAAAFEAAASALEILPSIYAKNPELEDQIEGYLLTLEIGRKISLDAAVMKHYLLGLTLQERALDKLRTLLKKHELTAEASRGLVVGLQMELSSPQELLPVLDTEYYLATRLLESQKLDPQIMEKEQIGLAARYLKMRPYFAGAEPIPKDLKVPDELLEWTDCAWASKQLSFLPQLERSRRGATQLAAVELMAALEAHQLDKGNYPLRLEELVPAYLTRIPEDGLSPDGHFEYVPDKKGYRLSSHPKSKKADVIDW
jgi:hypothetical protein